MNRFSKNTRAQGLGSMLSVAGAVAALFLASCIPTRSADPDAMAQTLTQVDDDWSKAAATRDAERVASFYAEDAIAYPPNEPAAVGRPAAHQVWASYFADSTFSISWKTSHAGVAASGDLGFTAGTYEDSFRGADGVLVRETGKYVCTWKKQNDGSWKATHDIWNTDSK